MKKYICVCLLLMAFILGNTSQADAHFTAEIEFIVLPIEVELYESEEEVNIDENFGDGDSKVVWIDPTPEMPDLKIALEQEDIIDYKVKMKLEISYDVHFQTDQDVTGNGENEVKERDNTDYFPISNNNEDEWYVIESGEEKEWVVDFNDYFRGGEATLYWEVYSDEDNNEELISEGEYVFYIRGENPENDVVEEYVQNHEHGHYWYSIPLVRHESYDFINREYYNQFVILSEDGDNYGPADHDNEGEPTWGGPDGWGLMQLDPATDEQYLWNWQANVNAGLNLSYEKRADTEVDRSADSAIRWLKRQLSHAIYYNYTPVEEENEQNNIRAEDIVPSMPVREYHDGIVFDEPHWSSDLEGNQLENTMDNAVGRFHVVDQGQLPDGLEGEEYQNLDDAFRDDIDISDHAYIVTENEDGTYNREEDIDNNITLYDALAIRLYNGGLYLVYVYDGDPEVPNDYVEEISDTYYNYLN